MINLSVSIILISDLFEIVVFLWIQMQKSILLPRGKIESGRGSIWQKCLSLNDSERQLLAHADRWLNYGWIIIE